MCQYCGRAFTVSPGSALESTVPPPKPAPAVPAAAKAEAVQYAPMRTKCPNCGSQKTKVASSRGRLRWHKCPACKHSFKTVDAIGTSRS